MSVHVGGEKSREVRAVRQAVNVVRVVVKSFFVYAGSVSRMTGN